MIRLGLIVEGHGDVEAAPILVRRIAAEVLPGVALDVGRPIRIGRQKLIRPDELERAVELAARKLGGDGGIVILVDADDSCPGELGPALLERARAIRSDLPISVVLAKREFEAWFLAAAASLRGNRSLSEHLEPPEDSEAVRGAKEWLGRHMAGDRSYRETRDQAALAARMDLGAARSAPSFDKWCRDLEALLSQLSGSSQ